MIVSIQAKIVSLGLTSNDNIKMARDVKHERLVDKVI